MAARAPVYFSPELLSALSRTQRPPHSTVNFLRRCPSATHRNGDAHGAERPGEQEMRWEMPPLACSPIRAGILKIVSGKGELNVAECAMPSVQRIGWWFIYREREKERGRWVTCGREWRGSRR